MISILITGLIVMVLALWVWFGVIGAKVALGLIVLALVPAVFWFLQALVTELKVQAKDFCGDLSIKERVRKAQEDARCNPRPKPLTLKQAFKKAWDEEKRRSQN